MHSTLDHRVQLLRQWESLCDDPKINDLAYKVETNHDGQIIMSPHRPLHSWMQSRILDQFKQLLPEGNAMPEAAVLTEDGIRVADVAWVSGALLASQIKKSAFEKAPEICVEVASPSNKEEALKAKLALYIGAGAREVWQVDGEGRVRFFDMHMNETNHSRLCPAFPKQLNPNVS